MRTHKFEWIKLIYKTNLPLLIASKHPLKLLQLVKGLRPAMPSIVRNSLLEHLVQFSYILASWAGFCFLTWGHYHQPHSGGSLSSTSLRWVTIINLTQGHYHQPHSGHYHQPH